MNVRGAFLLVIMSGVAACRETPRTPEERGQHAFLRICSGCHGPDGRGRAVAGFKNPPRNLTDPDWQAGFTDPDIRKTIINGKGQMPPFGALLPPDEIEDLVRYVRTLRRKN